MKCSKSVIYLWRQHHIFIHNNTEMKGTQGMFPSHWQGLRVTSDESFLLIGKYFWMTKSLSLGLEAVWPWEPCFEQSTSVSGRWVEILVLVASLKHKLECRYNATIKRGSQQENHNGCIVSEAGKVCTNERSVIFSIELYISNSPSVCEMIAQKKCRL